MIALMKYNLYESDGLMTFKVVEPLAVETIVPNDTIASQSLMYQKGATVEGLPAQIVLMNPDGSFMEEVEGVLVEKDGGHLIFPYENVEEVASGVLSDVEKGIDKVEGALGKDLDKETVLGFSYKQLLFIGLITIVVAKIVKN